jgi:tRNA pseudouridine13 synthase
MRGAVKSAPEDFVVCEIVGKGVALEPGTKYTPDMLGMEEKPGKFCIFVLQKRNWNTTQALKEIARRLRKGMRSMGFAGTKDRLSVSTQLCSAFAAGPSQLASIHIKDIEINGAWSGDAQIDMGSLIGNRFAITVRGTEGQDSLEKALGTLNGAFPNYFGEQRFGFRNNNVSIGLSILKQDFEGAAMRFLTDTANELREEAVAARKELAETRDFKAALQRFPGYLKYERAMIEYLSRYPTNYANAIRKLPRSLSLMFVHAVEDSIFNEELCRRVESGETSPAEGELSCGTNGYGFPDVKTTGPYAPELGNAFLVGNLVGYDTKSPTKLESELLEEFGISLESFKANGIKELNCKGSFRVMFAPYKWVSSSIGQDDAKLVFELPAGSYATVLLDELVDSESGSPAGASDSGKSAGRN